MILTKLFPEDSIQIADLQHDDYRESLTTIYKMAKSEYQRAELIFGVHTELGNMLDIERFDHRTLQWFHDAIAGQFRFNYCYKGNQFENLVDGADILSRWRKFLLAEIQGLFIKFFELPRQILTATHFANPDPQGIAAEEYLYQLTLREYPNLTLKVRASDE